MPTYEYECKSCGHTFEAFQAMSEEPLKNCPQCGQEIRRLIFGGTGVIFKGSGFYVTDKGKESAAAKPSKPADAPSKGGSASESPVASSGKSESSGGESAPKKAGAEEKAAPAAKTA